ncbi:MAG: hypothetical protein JO276_15390 [Sphingomonadaceae bacterium]|nr:hypothetical protein [Sphingomonadaceae bacterium]
MAALRIIMLVVGTLAVLVGLLWLGQGLGIVRWPASSFMIDVSAWAVRGCALAVGGALMIYYGLRVGR